MPRETPGQDLSRGAWECLESGRNAVAGVKDLSRVYVEIHVVAMLGCGWVRGTWILPSTTLSPGSQMYHSEREVWILCVRIQRLSDLTILLKWELLFLFRFS